MSAVLADAHTIDPRELVALAERCYASTALFTPIRWHVWTCRCHGSRVYGSRAVPVCDDLTMRVPVEMLRA